MSLAQEEKIMWAQIIKGNKEIIAKVISEVMGRIPDYSSDIKLYTSEQVALLAMKRSGFEEAVKEIFQNIPSERTHDIASSFMDMSKD